MTFIGNVTRSLRGAGVDNYREGGDWCARSSSKTAASEQVVGEPKDGVERSRA